MEYNTLLFIGFLEAILCFDTMSLSTMRIKKPIKKNIAIGFITMVIIISIFFVFLVNFGIPAVENYAIIITLILTVTWYCICADDSFLYRFFNCLHLLIYILLLDI